MTSKTALNKLLTENSDPESERYEILKPEEVLQIQSLFSLQFCAEFVARNPVLDSMQEALEALA